MKDDVAASAEVYARSPLPLGNGTFTADGRLVVSHHPMYSTERRVSMFVTRDSLAPFPNAEWNAPRGDPARRLDAVLGLRTDSAGRVWLLDMGTRSKVPSRFVIWDTVADRLARVMELPADVLVPESEPNDFAIDEQHGAVYIADEGAGSGGDGSKAALIVVDIASGRARRRLQGRLGVRSCDDRTVSLNGRAIIHTTDDCRHIPMRVGVDGIALDSASEWLYYGPMSGHAIWRLRTADLANDDLDDDTLELRAERYADRPISGGMCMDDAGGLYLTEVAGSSIGYIPPVDRKYRRILTREDMFWPDGITAGPDGLLYVIVSQLPCAPPLNGGENRSKPPFVIVRFRPV